MISADLTARDPDTTRRIAGAGAARPRQPSAHRGLARLWPGCARRRLESGVGGVVVFLQGCRGRLDTGHSALGRLLGAGPRPGRTFEAAERIGPLAVEVQVMAAARTLTGEAA
ncbi:hypothetical protein ETD86_30975 [Nonomuraea turkmeniaca]|uniref:Uncharacterized protein n=1 Tax=Nonomuraea turkmeniaca TaxID=103838 RepID=A0A5S4F944_9ACTN|nr:hypothetical protein [Nonomuraea turkmeniaca]TMR13287.1 hypothetical protein ETD86_30975 [Nonomuraea turkmeniaca]